MNHSKLFLYSTIAAAFVFTSPMSVAGSANPDSPMIPDKIGAAAAAQLAADMKACLAQMPDYTHESVMVPMRDGVKLCTEILRPKNMDGPLPVIMQRSPYCRWDTNLKKHLDRIAKDTPAVVILQNQRGRFGSEGMGTFEADNFDNEINDSYDTIEWAASQTWCNGKVGMFGVSGSGFSGANALWSGAPHLVAVNLSISTDNGYELVYTNGVRRNNYRWLANRGMTEAKNTWPRPATKPFDIKTRAAFIAERGAKCQAALTNDTGWYDLFSESVLDAFAVLSPTNKAKVTIFPTGHGPIGGDLVYPQPRLPIANTPTFKDCITGNNNKLGESALIYFLMGDTKDPAAPGNIWKVTNKWPVPNTPTSLYLQKDGTLTSQPPKEKDATLAYDYDPKNPAPTLGGNWEFKHNNGPHDQRPSKERKDVLRFVSEPLTEPMGVTGKIWAELHISSDAPDTTFVATLVDIYPDGYEALVRQGAMMARYWQGFDKPARLEKGNIYKLEMDLWSTALVFNKGHRIAVHITSSSSPAFEVHPNTYDQVDSIDKTVAAHQTIHLSTDHPSRIILPVIAPESYANEKK